MVLKPLSADELKKFFDDTALEVINYFIKKAIFSQPEPLEGQKSLPIHIPKEHIEQWVVQALKALPVGSGSYPVDVVREGDWGADVKMLSCKVDASGDLQNGCSGETSLAQKFKETGVDLDSLFRTEKYEDILQGWAGIVREKLNAVKKDNNLRSIYYFFILRAGRRFFLCGLEVDVNEISNISVKNTSRQSVWAANYIDDNYGEVKVYKAKKRIELRLYPKCWVDNDRVIELPVPYLLGEKNIRDLVADAEKFKEYKIDISKKIFGQEEDRRGTK